MSAVPEPGPADRGARLRLVVDAGTPGLFLPSVDRVPSAIAERLADLPEATASTYRIALRLQRGAHGLVGTWRTAFMQGRGIRNKGTISRHLAQLEEKGLLLRFFVGDHNGVHPVRRDLSLLAGQDALGQLVGCSRDVRRFLAGWLGDERVFLTTMDVRGKSRPVYLHELRTRHPERVEAVAAPNWIAHVNLDGGK